MADWFGFRWDINSNPGRKSGVTRHCGQHSLFSTLLGFWSVKSGWKYTTLTRSWISPTNVDKTLDLTQLYLDKLETTTADQNLGIMVTEYNSIWCWNRTKSQSWLLLILITKQDANINGILSWAGMLALLVSLSLVHKQIWACLCTVMHKEISSYWICSEQGLWIIIITASSFLRERQGKLKTISRDKKPKCGNVTYYIFWLKDASFGCIQKCLRP